MSDARRVVILGTSGYAVELHDVAVAAGFVVDGFLGPRAEASLPAALLGPDALLDELPPSVGVLVAVGEPRVRERLFADARARGRRLPQVIHPRAWVAPSAVLGDGVVVYPQATVHAQVRLGEAVLVNSNATIGHETSIGAFSNVGPGCAVGGRCQFGDGVYLGIGASVIDRVAIAGGVLVGAGAAVVRDLPEPGVYLGVPALRKKEG